MSSLEVAAFNKCIGETTSHGRQWGSYENLDSDEERDFMESRDCIRRLTYSANYDMKPKPKKRTQLKIKNLEEPKNKTMIGEVYDKMATVLKIFKGEVKKKELTMGDEPPSECVLSVSKKKLDRLKYNILKMWKRS